MDANYDLDHTELMSQDRQLQTIKNLPLFNSLSDEELLNMLDECEIVPLKKGEILFSAGYPATHVYIILSGCTKLVRSNPDGRERIVHLLLRGEMFGAAVAMQGGFYPVNAIALEDCIVMKICTKAFQNYFLRHPKLGQHLIAQLGERLQRAHTDRASSLDPVDRRVGLFLLDLLARSNKSFGHTLRIPIPLTRQDIADSVGSTVETVIRTLSQWSKANLIITQDRYIEIPHPERLKNAINVTDI